MIFQKLREIAEARPDQLFLVDQVYSFSYEDAVNRVIKIAGQLENSKEDLVYLYLKDGCDLVLLLIAIDLLGKKACILNRQMAEVDFAAIFHKVGPGILISDTKFDDAVSGTRIISYSDPLWHESFPDSKKEYNYPVDRENDLIILTTGTTGLPKAALYKWETIIKQIRPNKRDLQEVWLLVSPLNHFAGIQVLLHSLVNGNALIIPPSRSFEDILTYIQKYNVDSISATPTFWRFFSGKYTKDLGPLNLKQITLGGEASTPELLEKLRGIFPKAVITQVYATTELGSCFSVKDGLPGFPLEYLSRPVGNVKLKILQDELYILSTKAMLGYAGGDVLQRDNDGWIATGDIVEIVGDRVLFRGRKSEIINVGGVKVHPLKVEAVILAIPGIKNVRVYGKKNPITGQIVAIQVEISDDVSSEAIEKEIRFRCQSSLGRYEQPRLIEFVSSIPKQNQKIIRR